MSPNILVVLPDKARVEAHLHRERVAGRNVNTKNVVSQKELEGMCEPKGWLKRKSASPLAARRIIARLAPQILGWPHCAEPEFAASFHALLVKWRECDFTATTLRDRVTPMSASVRDKMLALTALWDALDAELELRGAVDATALLQVATQRLATKPLPPMLLAFDGFEFHFHHDLFPARIAFLKQLSIAVEPREVSLYFPLGRGEKLFAEDSAGVELFVTDSMRRLESAGEDALLNVYYERDGHARTQVASVALSGERELTSDEVRGLSVVTFETPTKEAEGIAARVRGLLHQGVQPTDITVCFPALDPASIARLQAAFDACDVALAFPDAFHLGDAPRFRRAVGLLEMADAHFPAPKIAELMDAGWLPSREDSAHASTSFERAGVRDDSHGMPDGRGGFASRLAAYGESLGEKAEKARVDSLTASVVDAQKFLGKIPTSGSPLHLLEAWCAALNACGALETRFTDLPEGLSWPARVALERAWALDSRACKELCELLDALEDEFKAEEETATHRQGAKAVPNMTRRELARLVRSEASRVQLKQKQSRAAVRVTEPKQLGGLHFRYLFFGGLTDDAFPRTAAELPLLTREECSELRAAGIGFQTSVWDNGIWLPAQLAEDRFLFNQALASGDEVTLSRPLHSGEGREVGASVLLDAVRTALPSNERGEVRPSQRAIAGTPSFEDVANDGEFRTAVAIHAFGQDENAREVLRSKFTSEHWFQNLEEISTAAQQRSEFFRHPDTPSARFTGHIHGVALQHLAKRLEFGSARPLSASEMGVWGTCAFKGLAKYILKMPDSRGRGDEMSPVDFGTLLHVVLSNLGSGLLALQKMSSLKQRACISEAVNQAAATFPHGGPPMLRELEKERAVALLARLAKSGALMPFEDAAPTHFEQTFNPQHAKPPFNTVTIDDEGDVVFLSGKIDRIDVADGVYAIDYKAGAAPQKATVQTRLLANDFQLPIYLAALRAAYPDARAHDAAWIYLRDSKAVRLSDVQARRDAASPGGEPDQGPLLAAAIFSRLRNLRAGDCGPRSSDCDFCDYARICRLEKSTLTSNGERDGD